MKRGAGMVLYITSYLALIILFIISLVGYVNQNRTGEKIVSGYIYGRQHLSLLILYILSIGLWFTLVMQESSVNLLVFVGVPLSLFVAPSILGTNGLKEGARLIPRNKLVDYSIEADGRSRVKVHFKVQDRDEPVVMKVNMKQARELEQKLTKYFQDLSVH